MEYIYGALLLHSAGKEIDEENLKKVLKEAGVDADEARLKSLVTSLKEVKIDEVLKNASATLAAPSAAAPAESGNKGEKKKEEKKEEAHSEEALEGLSSLFG